MKKKLLSILLVFVLCFSLTACSSGKKDKDTAAPADSAKTTDGGEEQKAAENPDTAFPVKKDVTLTIWMPFTNTIIKSMDENPVIKMIKDKTGVTLKFIHPSAGDEATSLQLLLASGDLPDIIRFDYGQNAQLTYPGGGGKGIQDGVLLKLNDLIEQYAPNYKAVLARGGDYQKNTVTDDGTIWAMYTVANTTEDPWCGLSYRKDWADELGLGKPVTLDDWHTMLTAFKEKKGAIAPLMLPANGIMVNSEFLSAFGAAKDFYQVDGKVKYGYVEDGMKNYVTLMNKWYKEGLIDPNFTTNADFKSAGGYVLPTSYVAANKTGAGEVSWAASQNGFCKLYKATKDEKLNFAPVVPPVQKAGDETHFRYTTTPIYYPWAITKSCKTPEIAVEFMDWAYSEEGSLIMNYGEASNYTKVDGKLKFNDDMLYNDKYDFPTLLNAKTWENCPGIRDYTRAYQNVDSTYLDSCKVWSSAKSDYVIPDGINFTSVEASEKAYIMADITTYVEESIPKFITGDTSMDKWDSFVKQIKSMNIDRAIELEQASLDRYMSR
jgi:ABC-type sugar transport system, periplasmic component